MKKKSAGILAYRFRNKLLEILLVHPGGPYFANKDLGVWSIPKGEFTDEEDPLVAAKREFHEETGFEIKGAFKKLSPIVQKGGKTVFAWATEQDINTTGFKSNTFEIEWPPKSGKYQEYPEIDKAKWFTIPVGREKINESQVALINELIEILGSSH